MADDQSRYGGTFAGACESRWPVDARLRRPTSAAARTLRRKEQRQHTNKCLRQALTFAVVAKRSGISLQSMVIAKDLEVFRESLYGAQSGPSPDNVCPHLDAPHDYAMSGACTSFGCNTGAIEGYQSSCVQLDRSLKFSLEESDLQVSGSECDGSLRCDLQAHLSKQCRFAHGGRSIFILVIIRRYFGPGAKIWRFFHAKGATAVCFGYPPPVS